MKDLMLYNIEYNIRDLNDVVINNIKEIASNNDYEYHYHGSDRLVLMSNRGLNFTKLINEISNMCSIYNIDYFKLLNLD